MTTSNNTPILNTGRIIGVLILAQLFGGILINFNLTAPLFGSPGFMVNGAVYAQKIGAATLGNLVLSGLSIWVAILVFPLFKKHSQALAITFLGLSIVGIASTAVENIGMMSMVSFSKAATSAGATATAELFEPMKVIVASIRNWAHYTNLLLGGITLMIMYVIMFRFTLVPKIIAGFGIFAVALQLTTISMPFLGESVNFMLMAPIGLAQLALSLWLIVKGFRTER